MSFSEKYRPHFADKLPYSLATRVATSVVSDSHVRPSTYFLLAIAVAILAGLAEVAIITLNRYLLDNLINIGHDYVWAIPVANVMIFAIPGILLYLLARFGSIFVRLNIAIFFYATLGFLALLLLIPRLHSLAALLLAVGLSIQVARLATKPDSGWRKRLTSKIGRKRFWSKSNEKHEAAQSLRNEGDDLLVARRKFVFAAGSAVVGLALGTRGWQRLNESRSLRWLPQAPVDSPNVLLIVLDTVRAQSLSFLGYNRPTSPQLERIARNSVNFEQVLSTAPWTLPAHASMFTGRYPFELSTGFLSALDDTHPTLAEVLKAHGYLTSGFVANTEYCSYEFGLNRGFIHYEDYAISAGEIVRGSSLARLVAHSELRRIAGYDDLLGRKSAERINRDFLTWLSKQEEERSFFAFLNYFDAHDPYLPPDEYALMFAPERPRGHLPPSGKGLSEQDINELQNAYDGSIAYLDHHVGLLLDQLEQRSLLDNTLVIITSDHGEQFGEHGLMGHANSLYMPLLRVPLLMSLPSRIPEDVRVQEMATLADIPTTVLDILGISEGSTFPGKSLARYWDNSTKMTEPILSEADAGIRQPEWYPTASGEMKSLTFDGMHYIRHSDDCEELYDIESDPEETHDLASKEESRAVLEKFQLTLESMLGVT